MERFRAASKDFASTGPRSFERGNKELEREVPALTEASTGPRSFERGNSALVQRVESGQSLLQRGRAHSSAEINPATGEEKTKKDASTGPRSFERGNRNPARKL